MTPGTGSVHLVILTSGFSPAAHAQWRHYFVPYRERFFVLLETFSTRSAKSLYYDYLLERFSQAEDWSWVRFLTPGQVREVLKLAPPGDLAGCRTGGGFPFSYSSLLIQ